MGKILIKKLFCLLLAIFAFAAPISVFASSTSAIAQAETATDESGKAEIFEASISELVSMLESGKITSEKLCEVYLERIETYDKGGVKLNSVISLNKNALAQARQMDLERSMGTVRGVLHGIPILVKDNIDVSGFPTTLGKTSLADKIAGEDAAAVAALVKQGAIILGKTNLSTDDTATRYTVSSLLGETRNAYNTAFSAGGSSGGSAVAVSANFAAAALATDTNFSLCYPAALNGVVALRPTHALVDYTGCVSVVKARDVVAPVTRSVKDSALLLDVMTNNADNAPYTGALSETALKGKTIAVVKELSGYTYNSPNEWRQSDDNITELFEAALDIMRGQGANVVTVSVPKLFTYYNICRESAAGSAQAKANLLAELKMLLSQNGASAFVFPAYLSSPMPSDFDAYGSHNAEGKTYLNCGGYLPSLVGLPAVCVPMGMHKDGVSTGLEFVSLENTDAQLLSLAYSYEQAAKNRTVPETVPNLYKIEQQAENVPTESQPDFQTTVSSQPQQLPTDDVAKRDAFSWQVLAVALIIAAVLALCVWVLVFGYRRDSKKDAHKNRHF